MLFSALVAVSLALVSASPTPAIDHAGSLVAARTINDCETGTSDDHTSINSPLVEHCMQLAENILGDGTWYYTDDTKPRQLAQYKSCAFTVKLPECRGMFCLQQTASMVMVKIGNEDIRGAIHNAVDVAKKVRGIPGKPRVGAVGTFSCQGGLGIGGHQAIDWDLHWDPAYVEPGQVSRKSLPFEQRNVDAAQTINDCDNINRWWPLRGTDDSSPFIADCEKLADNIIGDGTWDLSSHGATRQLAQYKSCSFSAVSAICGGDRPVMGKVWV
ncbi:putative necrosis-inducing factor-domain-containing protein [Podospora conica]|nr:putative necrosis-inducing factor-domain-containing protein [Schizothecium conicum]